MEWNRISQIESIPFSEFENFAGRIFEISREYIGATRPLPLLTYTTGAETSHHALKFPRSPAPNLVRA
jgi:hypothetical protein